jgi:UDP-GlcNAc:undecaprenyl-phosphate/decaprenyl-phosphate GlcNAc-1-phosphate transferase
MMVFVGSVLLSFAISLAIMPFVISWAKRHKLYDPLDPRKIHHGQIPRLGGVGIVIAFVATICLITLLTGKGANTGGHFWVVVVSAVAIPVLGLVDDFKNLRARFKFAVELVAALAIVAGGFRFKELALPFGTGALELGALSYPLTLLWIIGVTNAMNLIDGMDGQAGGISALAALGAGIYFILVGHSGGAMIAFALVGAVLGFLCFNFPPAKIFMGDAGSLFLGFILSILPLLAPRVAAGEVAFFITVTLLLIPIYDTFSAMIRRGRAHVSFFTPDRLHLHHKLLDLGLSNKGVLAVVYSAQIILDSVALSPLYLPYAVSFWLIIGSWAVYAALFAVLDAWALKRSPPVAPAVSRPSGRKVAMPATKKSEKLASTLVNQTFGDGEK